MDLYYLLILQNSFFAASSGEGCIDSLGLHQNQTKGVSSEEEGKVQCVPLYSILLAANRSRIDYLSIDVKGQELKVLLTVPWNRVDITVKIDYILHSSSDRKSFCLNM